MRKRRVLLTALFFGLTLSVLFIVFLVAKDSGGSETVGEVNTESISVGLHEREDAVNALTSILELGAIEAGEGDLREKISSIDSNTVNEVSPKLLESVRSVENDLDRRVAAVRSVVAISSQLKDDNGVVSRGEDLSDVVIDVDKGIAYIPTSIYNENGLFMIEMVKVGDKWVLSPYTFVNEVAVAANVSASQPSR